MPDLAGCPSVNCLTTAWKEHAPELRAWAQHRLGNAAETDDLMQELFLKSLRQGERFCSVTNARAWLFEVARNTLADRFRVARETVEVPEDLPSPLMEIDTVDSLTACLPRVLSELSAEDRDVITQCDLLGKPQADFATERGIKLSTAKSRLQRARQRLKAQMTRVCQVQLDPGGRVQDFVPRS